MTPDPRLEDLKATPIGEIADRLGIQGLRVSGLEKVGPCPVCGGRDRFSLAPRKNLWNCRHCAKGGDQVELVMHHLGCDFRAALTWFGGEAVDIDPAEKARRAAAAQARAAQQAATQERFRQREIGRAKEIWRNAVPAGSLIRDYFEARGLPYDKLDRLPSAIRYQAALPLYHRAEGAKRSEVVHEGPAMVTAIQSDGGMLIGVHLTWLDLSAVKGRLRLDGIPTKKIRGSKTRAAIRLAGPPDATTMIMGEGIETTLSAALSRPGPRYWAGIDLGHMGGRIEGGKRKALEGRPDLDDAKCFLPPAGIETLIYIQDGDSDPDFTRGSLMAGLRRAKALTDVTRIAIVHPGAGIDFNDLIKG